MFSSSQSENKPSLLVVWTMVLGGLFLLVGLGTICKSLPFLAPLQKSPAPMSPKFAGTISGLRENHQAVIEISSPDKLLNQSSWHNGPWGVVLGGLTDGVYIVRASRIDYTVKPISYTVSIKNRDVEGPSLDFVFTRE